MHFFSVYHVEFDWNRRELYEDVKAINSDEAKSYILRNFSGSKIVSVTNLTREDLINKFGQLLLAEIPMLKNPQAEKLLKNTITAFLSVADTEYDHYIKNYPVDSVANVAKKVFKQMTGGNKTF